MKGSSPVNVNQGEPDRLPSQVEIDATFSEAFEVEPGVWRIIRRPELEVVDGWAYINLPKRDVPSAWTFISEVVPPAESTNGGSLRRFCPLCTVQPVESAGREQPLRRRHYADLCDTFWDCLTCKTTWREP